MEREQIRNWGACVVSRKKLGVASKRFSVSQDRRSPAGKIKISAASGIVMVSCILLGAVAMYLYQVNLIATKGFEIREAENRIQELEKQSQDLKIQEVELESMYNIEKSRDSFDLVNNSNITYAEMKSPVAMK